MNLTNEQLESYRRDGFVVLNGVFSEEEIDVLHAALAEDQRTPGPHLIMEDDGVTLRAIYASHLRHSVFRRLVRLDRLVVPAQQLAGDRALYVHQLKVNDKRPFGGSHWAWHQDYIVWRNTDNLRAPALVNACVFLDDVTEFNGPVVYLRGSHALGTVERTPNSQRRSAQHVDPDDYALSSTELISLLRGTEMVSAKGARGSVVLFHPEIVHGSAMNISPFARKLLIVTYNPIANAPQRSSASRPEYLVGRATEPIVPEPGSLSARPGPDPRGEGACA